MPTHGHFQYFIYTVHGEFSEWSSWSNCTTSCGGGKRFKTRACNSPSPMYGGNNCIGDVIITEDCNVHFCPGKLVRGFTD